MFPWLFWPFSTASYVVVELPREKEREKPSETKCARGGQQIRLKEECIVSLFKGGTIEAFKD